MGLKAKVGGTGTDFEPAPEGMKVARCYMIVDLGTQESEYKGEKRKAHKVLIGWELPGEMREFDNSEGETIKAPAAVLKRYTLSVHEKATLRADLTTWFGKEVDWREVEMTGEFDLEAAIGRPALLNIVHATNGGKTYANVASVNPLPDGMECPEPINEPVFFSLDEDGFDYSVYEDLSEGMRNIVERSPEFQRAASAENVDVPF